MRRCFLWLVLQFYISGMRIISCNVRHKNKKIKQLLNYIFEHNPDVVCLQELPLSYVSFISNNYAGAITYTLDFLNNLNPDSSGSIVTWTKEDSVTSRELNYYDKKARSFLNSFYYLWLYKDTEHHSALVTDLKTALPNVNIYNMRVSCAVGSNERLDMLKNIFSSLDTTKVNIICGDLNIPDSNFFNKITGPFRGFTLQDYFTNEYKVFQKLLTHYGFENNFFGSNTTYTKLLSLQLDHILVPKGTLLKSHQVLPHSHGSDHRAILLDFELPV